MTYIGELYAPEELRATNFNRIHLFYSLFCSVAHCFQGIEGLEKTPRPKIKRQLTKVRVRLDEISSRYDDEYKTKEYEKFVDYSRRATTDTARRRFRSTFICRKLAGAV